MTARKCRIPKYRHYKPKDLGAVRIDGQDHYLGKFDSAASWERYHRLIAQWLHNGHHLLPDSGGSSAGSQPVGMTVSEVILRYWRFAEEYYQKNGRQSGEAHNIRAALRPVRRLYGSILAKDFGPDAVEVIQRPYGTQHRVLQMRGLLDDVPEVCGSLGGCGWSTAPASAISFWIHSILCCSKRGFPPVWLLRASQSTG